MSKKDDSNSGNHVSEIEHRLTTLEKLVSDLNKSQLDNHKWFTTVVFSLVAILLTVLGINSRNEVRDTTRDMKSEIGSQLKDSDNKFETERKELETKFLVLSGNALKKPQLQISTSQGSLDGTVFQVPSNLNFAEPFFPLFLKNIGDKRTEPLSIRLYCSDPISIMDSSWETLPSNDPSYRVVFHRVTGTSLEIAPKEIWTLYSTDGIPTSMQTNNLQCKLQVFYGGDEPAEAKFSIRVK